MSSLLCGLVCVDCHNVAEIGNGCNISRSTSIHFCFDMSLVCDIPSTEIF